MYIYLVPHYFSYFVFVTAFFQKNYQSKFLPTANKLHKEGYSLFATEKTAKYLNEHNIPAQPVAWPLDAHHKSDVDEVIPNAKR